MEIRKYTDIVGGVAVCAIKEGLMCIMTSNGGLSKDFGSETDLPGSLGLQAPSRRSSASRPASA